MQVFIELNIIINTNNVIKLLNALQNDIKHIYLTVLLVYYTVFVNFANAYDAHLFVDAIVLISKHKLYLFILYITT